MKIVVVGAGAAGLAAATRAKRVNPEAEVIVFEATSEYSRGTCSLPYLLSGELQDPRLLQGIQAETLAERGIDLRLNTKALEIQPHQRRLQTEGESLQYDRLIVSTGARARRPEGWTLPLDSPTAWSLRSLSDVSKIKKAVSDLGVTTVAVIGGGYVGVEFAEALQILGLQVTLFHRQSTLMRSDPDLNSRIVELLRSRGIRVELDTEIRQVEADGKGYCLSGRKAQAGDVQSQHQAVALALGIEPEASLLQSAGARVGSSGAVVVSARGETNLSNVYACGDGVEVPSSRGGPGRWIPLATAAARLGRVCGENAAGGSRRFGSALASLSLRLFTEELGFVGLPQDWQGCQKTPFSWGSPNHPFLRRQGGHGVLFSDPRSGRLRGIQVLGKQASHLVDLVSLCVEQDLTVQDLQEQDFSYNPPLSGLWHPLYLAARTAEKSTRQYSGGY